MTLTSMKGYLKYLSWTLVAVFLAALAMQSCSPPPAPATVPMVAVASPVVADEKKVEVTIESPKKSVRVYKPTVKASLPLPATVITDATKHVITSSDVKPREGRQVVTSVIDVTTGETTTYVAEAPSPWLSLENRGAINLDYGFKRANPNPVGRLNIRQDIVQIKQVHLGVSASAYTDGDYFVGIGGGYRW